MASHDQSFLVTTTRYSPEMGLGEYRDHSRKLKKPRPGCGGRRGATQRALRRIQRAGCIDSTPLDGGVNYLTSRKLKRMAIKSGAARKPPITRQLEIESGCLEQPSKPLAFSLRTRRSRGCG